ncbi:hypothetical protein ILUMI_16705, partial [Ignelater luminosus]
EFLATKTKKKNIIKRFPAPKAGARNNTSEIDAFLQIVDVPMIEEIVERTNMYINYKRLEYERERDAKETSKTEVMALLGLLYLLGYKKHNHTNVLEIRTTDGSGMEIARTVMSYKRFLFLLRCLCFDNKFTRIERRKQDTLAAIRSIFDSFVKNCKLSYSLGEFVTIDEKLQAFRGRCSFVQYIPNKPAKYGIKMFALCDAKTFCTDNLEIYCVKQPEGPYMQSNSPTDIVNKLQCLFERKLTFLGTMRQNKREIPPDFLPDKKRKVHSVLFGFQKEATLVSF